MSLFFFFDGHDLSGKQVYLFCSHGTGGLASSVTDISKAIPDAEISDNVFDVYTNSTLNQEENMLKYKYELQ